MTDGIVCMYMIKKYTNTEQSYKPMATLLLQVNGKKRDN